MLETFGEGNLLVKIANDLKKIKMTRRKKLFKTNIILSAVVPVVKIQDQKSKINYDICIFESQDSSVLFMKNLLQEDTNNRVKTFLVALKSLLKNWYVLSSISGWKFFGFFSNFWYSTHTRVKPINRKIKNFLVCWFFLLSGIINAVSGYLNSFAVVLMGIKFLQHSVKPTILSYPKENLQKVCLLIS